MNCPKAPLRPLCSLKSVKTLSLTSLADVQSNKPAFTLANSPVNTDANMSLTPTPDRPTQMWGGVQPQPLFQSQFSMGCNSCAVLPTCGVTMGSSSSVSGVDDDDDASSAMTDDSYESESERIMSTVEESLITYPFEVTEEQMEQEYKDINTYERSVIFPKKSFSAGRSNALKNRYSDIVPYDDTLVQIIPCGKENCFDCFEYNYINDKKSPKWIATQGPLYRTFNEFWRMIYENDISYIVMLANLVERNFPKVDQYWTQLNFGPLVLKCLTVTMTAELYVPDTNNSVIYRQFEVKPINGTCPAKIVHHFQYCGWPDHGVPSDYGTILRLINIINEDRKTRGLEGSPVVVHCSAGVGRTGTYCAIDMTLREILEQVARYGPDRSKISFNLYKNALILRNARTRMIEQYEQYKFCYNVLKYAVSKMNLI